jgi:Flp pilus assembly protein TadG
MLTAIRSACWTRLSSPLRLCRFWAHDERGSMAILTGISLTVLIAFAGLGVDVSMWLRAKNNVQSAADAAANSAAAAAAQKSSDSRVQAEADAAAAANGFQNAMNGVTVTVNHPPASGRYAGNANAYEVIIGAPQKLYLASVLPGATAPTVTGRTVALLNTTTLGDGACILGLSKESKAVDVTFNGNTSVIAHGCDVDADSPALDSINTNGGGSVHAANIFTVGGIAGNNVYLDCGSVGTTGCGNTGQPSIADPYAGRTIPSPTSHCNSNCNWSGHVSNTGNPPVMAINGGVNVTANTTLDPGVYIINNGSFSMAGNGSQPLTVSGTGVTIILTSSTPSSDNGVFSITGQAALNLTAPTTTQVATWGIPGSVEGIALWADIHLPSKEDKFTGGTTNGLYGAVYLPNHDVKFAGNSNSNANGCTQLIGYNVIFTGTSNFSHNCAGNSGVADPPGPTLWSLVE